MSLSDLRKLKKEWLSNTVTRSYLKQTFKLSEKEISQIKSEVKYGKERYCIQHVKECIDSKISKLSSSNFSGDTLKRCSKCKENTKESLFSNTKTEICMKCEKRIENQTNKILEKINDSRSIRPSRDQRQLL